MTSSSFDKMLRQYQGSLPDNRKLNYWEAEDPGNNVEAINNSIDELKNDFAERTAENIEIAKAAAERPAENIKALTGLIKPLKNLHDYHKAKEIQNARYESYTKQQQDKAYEDRVFEQAEKESTIDVGAELDGLDVREVLFRFGEGGTLSNEVYAWLRSKNLINEDGTPKPKAFDAANDYIEHKRDLIRQKKLIRKQKELLAENPISDLDTAEQAGLVLPNESDVAEKDAGILINDLVNNFDSNLNALLGVQKQLPNMTKPMSYLEAVSEFATAEDNQFAGALLQDAVADYLAFNKDGIDKIGENRFKNDVFPTLYNQAQTTHKKFMGITLENARKQNKKTMGQTFANELRSEGIMAYTGPHGMVSIQELQADGTKNNMRGWQIAADMTEYIIDQGMITGRELNDVINDPILARDGSVTDLETLKPHWYNKISNIAIKAHNEEVKTAIAEKENDVIIQTDALFEKAAEEGQGYPSPAAARQLHSELSAKHGLREDHQVFNRLKSIAYASEKSPGYINNILNYQQEKGWLLSDDLIAELPEGTNKNYWKGQAKILGIRGVTKDELDEIQSEAEDMIKDEMDINDITQRVYAKEREAIKRSPNFFYNRYKYYMRADNQEDTAAAKAKAMSNAMEDLRVAIETRNTENENKQLWGALEVDKFEKNVLDNHDNLVGFISTRGIENSLNTDKYVNQLEEAAILAGIEADKNGEALPAWFQDNHRYYNKTPRELFKARVEATSDLRDGDSTDIKVEDKYHLKPLAVKPNAGKTASHIIDPTNTDNMLEDLKKDDADLDSTFDLPEKITLEKPISQMTVREILNLRNTLGFNDDAGFGIYDLKMLGLVELFTDPQLVDYIGLDSVFDEDTQRRLMYARILQKGNKAGSFKTQLNTWRRVKWLDDAEVENFISVVAPTADDAKYWNDPYRSLNTLSNEVAKAALNDAAENL